MRLLAGCINTALVILKPPLTSQSVWFGAAAGEIEALTVMAPPYRVQSRDDLLRVASALVLLVVARCSGRETEAAPNLITAGKGCLVWAEYEEWKN